jgi:O-antigen ligase
MSFDLPRIRTPGLLWAGMILLVVLAFCPALEQPGRAAREALLLVGAPFLLAVAVASTQTRPGTLFSVLLGWAALAGALGIALAPGPERLAVARDLFVIAAPWVVAVGAALYRPDDEQFDEWIELGAVAALIAVGLLGLAQGWWGWTGIDQSRPPAATFVNRNVAAQMLVVLVPLGAPALLAGRRGWIRWMSAMASGLGLAFLIATRTRGAWLGSAFGFALGAAVWFASKRELRKRVRIAPVAAVAALVLVAVLVPVRGAARPLPSVKSTVGTLHRAAGEITATRLALWRNTLALTADHPWLGVGAGRFGVVFPLYHAAVVETPGFGTEHQVEHAHGDALEFAAELGPAAAVALAVLLIGAVVLAFRRARDATKLEEVARWAARVAAIAGALLHGVASFSLHSPASAFLVWLVLGRCWACTSRSSDARHPRRLATAVALAVILFGLWLGAQELRSQSALRTAVHGIQARDCPRVLESAADVHRLAPWRRRDAGIAAMAVFECQPDPEASLVALEDALAMYPHQLNLLLAVGARRLKAGAPSEAESAFDHAVEIAPSLGRAWLGLAMARTDLGDRDGAVQACAIALRIDPAFRPAVEFCAGNGLARP